MLAGDQEFKDTPLDQGKPKQSGHEELKLLFEDLNHLLGLF